MNMHPDSNLTIGGNAPSRAELTSDEQTALQGLARDGLIPLNDILSHFPRRSPRCLTKAGLVKWLHSGGKWLGVVQKSINK